jgi:hypothetical protein
MDDGQKVKHGNVEGAVAAVYQSRHLAGPVREKTRLKKATSMRSKEQ